MTNEAPAEWHKTALRIALCLLLSLLAHWGSQELLAGLPPRPPPKPRPTRVTMTVTERKPEPVAAVVIPTPPPEPIVVPEPAKLEPVPEPVDPPPEVPHERQPDVPPPRTPRPPTPAAKVESPTPNREPAPNAPTVPLPLTGITIESTSTTGNGPAMPVGNTHAPANPNPVHGTPQQLPAAQAPAPTYEVTHMPTMKGDCRGKYTDAARDEGIEGTVMLDLVVAPDGTTRDIKVVKGLGHGLDEAAIATLARCRFKPGTRGDTAVAVQLRAFKVRFFLDENGR